MESSNQTPAIALDVRDLRMRYDTRDFASGCRPRGRITRFLGRALRGCAGEVRDQVPGITE